MTINEIGPKISEALVSTALGLGVAIIGAMSFNFFTSRVEQFVIDMNDVSSEFIDYVLREGRALSSCASAARRTSAPPLAHLRQEGPRRLGAERHQRDAARRRHAGAAHHLHADDADHGPRPRRATCRRRTTTRRRRTRCSRSCRSSHQEPASFPCERIELYIEKNKLGPINEATLKEMGKQIEAAWKAPKNPEGVGRVYIKADDSVDVQQGLPGAHVPEQGARSVQQIDLAIAKDSEEKYAMGMSTGGNKGGVQSGHQRHAADRRLARAPHHLPRRDADHDEDGDPRGSAKARHTRRDARPERVAADGQGQEGRARSTFNDGDKDKPIQAVDLAKTLRPKLEAMHAGTEKVVFVDFEPERAVERGRRRRWTRSAASRPTSNHDEIKVALKVKEDQRQPPRGAQWPYRRSHSSTVRGTAPVRCDCVARGARLTPRRAVDRVRGCDSDCDLSRCSRCHAVRQRHETVRRCHVG